jgi:hypothetical protein
MLAFQNLSAPRGTGGYLGVIGMLEAVDGRIVLDSLGPVGDVPEVPPVEVPKEVGRRYGAFGVRTTMWASNYPPDVPTSSRIAMEIWERAGEPNVDGVIWADTVWMSEMLAATVPVSSSAWPEPIDAGNVVEILNRRVFESLDTPATNDIQTQIGTDLWTSVLAHQPDPAGLATAMSAGARGGHFAAFSTDEPTQATLARLGVAGEFELGENPLAVVWQDASASRAGYFAELGVRSTVSLDAAGGAAVETSIEMSNGAPDRPASILLGEKGGAPVGWWGVDAEVYLPDDAVEPDVQTSQPSVFGVERAYDHPVADAFLYADAGKSSSATVSFSRPNGTLLSGDVWTYATQVRPQPTLRPMPYSLDVELPTGAEIVQLPPGASFEDGVVRWSGEPEAPIELVIAYRIPG